MIKNIVLPTLADAHTLALDAGQMIKTSGIAVYAAPMLWAKKDHKLTVKQQMEMCRDYLGAESFTPYIDETVDNDVSSLGGDSWQRLLDDAECRKIRTVVVADLAAIGPTCGMAQYYVGKFFYPGRVRFIDVRNNLDSFSVSKDAFTVYLDEQINLFNKYIGERRVKERAAAGRVNRNAVLYGYVYRDNSPNIFVDDQTEEFVKLIFKLAIEGASEKEIIASLTEAKAPSTQVRKHELYGYFENPQRKWTRTPVRNILQNQIYTGDYVCMRQRERQKDGVRTYTTLSRDDWTVIKDHHEPIVDRAIYEEAITRFDLDWMR